MRVLLVSGSSGSRGGGEQYLVYLGRALAARGHEVILWASDHPQMDELAEDFAGTGQVVRSRYTNMYLRPLRSLGTCVNFGTSARIAAEWAGLNPDVVHVNKQNLEDGLDLLRAAARTRLPCVCTIHLTQNARFLGAKLAGLRDRVAARELRKFPGIFLTVQEQRGSELEKFLAQPARIEVVHNGVPLLDEDDRLRLREAKRRELGLGERDLLVLGVGRLMPQKRPRLFLEVAGEIAAAVPGSRFIWVGSGELEGEWDGWVRELGLGNVVRRVGWQRAVYPWLSAGDAFLHVAQFEGMPLALFEAMAARLPCVVTPNLLDDMPFLSRREVLVAEAGPDWTGGLAAADRRLATAEAGRDMVRRRFSHAAMAERSEAVYRMAIRGAE